MNGFEIVICNHGYLVRQVRDRYAEPIITPMWAFSALRDATDFIHNEIEKMQRGEHDPN